MDTISNPGFAAVSAVSSLLSSLTVPYWIIGGWAIDLAVGRVTRDHTDVDVMMLERDKHALWGDLTKIGVEPTDDLGPGRLVLHSDTLPLPAEVFLSRADGTSLVYRRGAYSITRALTDVTRYRDGIPYLAPEVVLLFKARSTAARDRHDVETALPLLDAEQRSWLHDTLKLLQLLPRGKPASVRRR